MNQWGRRLRLSLFGESHGEGVGVTVDGLPPGLAVDPVALQEALDRRRPGASPLVSQRREPDRAEILSGVHGGKATGAPLTVWIRNLDAQGAPYQDQPRLPRPSHADWVNHVWARGHEDPRGGGHSSGRLTAPLVAAGALVEPLLAGEGIRCAAHLHQVHDLRGPDHALGAGQILERAPRSPVFTAHAALEERFVARIEEARRGRDSVGGVVEFACDGLRPALGDPFFDSVESTVAHLLFAIPAVKGVGFGAGFRAAALRGSEHNDPYAVRGGKVVPAKNDAGGVLAGRTTGAELWGHVAVKPTASIFLSQRTVDLERMAEATLELKGRHDPCIAIRAVPVVQAALRLAVADLVLLARQEGHAGGP